ncbi:hypothetical protein ABTM19_20845, partial [Acinetobacter baumannii]
LQKMYDHLTDGTAVIIIDFKMKLLPVYYREAMTAWFGKRGMAVFGAMVVTKKTENERAADPRSTSSLTTSFIDVVADENSEDA